MLKRWMKVAALCCLAGSVGLAGYVYFLLEPRHHFEKANVPVLAVPPAAAAPEAPRQPAASVTMDGQQEASPQTEAKTKAFNVLLLGVDAREDEKSRSDVMMAIRVMPAQRRMNIVSVPRDTRVEIKGIGFTKINHAHILGEMEAGNEAGTKAAIKAVSSLLEIPINYYVKTNFQGFEHFIDMVGGVDVEVEQDMLLRAVGVTLRKGTQHIDGSIALGLVRERWAFADGDFGRQAEQAQILRNVAEELLKPEHIPRIAGLLSRLKQDILDTNFSDSDLISLAWLFQGMKAADFEYMQIPGHSGYEMDALMNTRLYYWIPDTKGMKTLQDTYFN